MENAERFRLKRYINMLYIIDDQTDPYWNLAAEEYLLKEKNEPVFRLWRNDNSIIVGHYQNTLAEIDTEYVKRHGIKVVRRLTGGGAVFHDLGNINFTFIEKKIPGEDSGAMFRRFTAPILEALGSLGIKAYLEGRNDLLIEGRKFSGNALCIHKDRILQHGTLLFSASMTNLSQALKSRPEKFIGKAVRSNLSRVTNISEHLKVPMDVTEFINYLGNHICGKYRDITPYEYTESDREAIEKLKDSKYVLDEWNFGKSPAYSFGKTAKLTGGVVEVYFSVEKGRIKDLQIFGDYFFTRPTEEFVRMIEGTPHTRQALDQTLGRIGSVFNDYFSNIAKEELLGMFFD